MAKNKNGILYFVIGVVLILLSLSVVGYNVYEDLNASRQSKILLQEIKSADTANNYNEIDNKFCGTVKIDSLNIELPVFNELNSKNLKISPCRYVGSIDDDNIIIAAHNYKSHFGNLKKLQIDDSLSFTENDGTKHLFSVKEILTLDGTAVYDMQAGEWDFTLFTCTKGGKQRVTVRCERIE